MSGNISGKVALERQQCLDSLDEFIATCQENITNMLDTLGWTPEHFMQPRNLCVCPYDSNHHVPEPSFEEHKIKCCIRSQGYSKDEADKILEDRSYFYKDSPCVYPVKLDLQTLNSVLWNHHVQNHSVFYGYKKLPRLPEEEQQLMSREDRLGLAEYIIKRAKEANRLKELGRDELLVSENLADLIKKDTEERKLDPFEEMAALRDFRRRRQTYRAKNVHITKKSHTEIMREVINNQMEMFSQSIKAELGEESNPSTNENAEDRLEGQGHSVSMETSERPGRYDPSHRDHRSSHDSDRDRDRKRYRSRSPSRNRSYKKPYRRSRSRSEDRESHTSHRSSRDHHSPRSHHSSQYRSRSRTRDDGGSRSKHREEEYRDKSRSKSNSPDRSKKSKHKKHKHKKEKKSKKRSRKEEEESGDNKNTKSRESSVH